MGSPVTWVLCQQVSPSLVPHPACLLEMPTQTTQHKPQATAPDSGVKALADLVQTLHFTHMEIETEEQQEAAWGLRSW